MNTSLSNLLHLIRTMNTPSLSYCRTSILTLLHPGYLDLCSKCHFHGHHKQFASLSIPLSCFIFHSIQTILRLFCLLVIFSLQIDKLLEVRGLVCLVLRYMPRIYDNSRHIVGQSIYLEWINAWLNTWMNAWTKRLLVILCAHPP